MADKLMHIPNDKQNYPFFRLQLVQCSGWNVWIINLLDLQIKIQWKFLPHILVIQCQSSKMYLCVSLLIFIVAIFNFFMCPPVVGSFNSRCLGIEILRWLRPVPPPGLADPAGGPGYHTTLPTYHHVSNIQCSCSTSYFGCAACF